MPIDHERLLAEIRAEVEQRRASGQLPVELERELDRAFARHIPASAIEGPFAQVLDQANGAALIDARAPATSERPGVPAAKRALQRSVAWMLDYVAAQVSGFNQATVRALAMLDERVTSLERAIDAGNRPDAHGGTSVTDADHWSPALADLFGNAGGRVVVAECRDAALVSALRDAGVDAYGVEPDEDTVRAAAGRGLEIRADDAATHLSRVQIGALGGVVLAACVDILPVAAKTELLNAAVARARDGGVVAVIGADPETWAARAPIAADLAPGRPLHAATWEHLFRGAGLEPTVATGPESVLVSARR